MSHCREESYGEFGTRLTRAGAPSRLPLSGSIEITFRTETAAGYRAYADRVASGWTPAGAILPRSDALSAQSSPCTSGGCMSRGCGKSATNSTPITQLLQIELPARRRESIEENAG